jgi:hypothetical protein
MTFLQRSLPRQSFLRPLHGRCRIEDYRRFAVSSPEAVDGHEYSRAADDPSFQPPLAREIEQCESENDQQDAGPRYARQRQHDAEYHQQNAQKVLDDPASPADDRVPVGPEFPIMMVAEIRAWQFHNHPGRQHCAQRRCGNKREAENCGAPDPRRPVRELR